jgi:hypothetical protein
MGMKVEMITLKVVVVSDLFENLGGVESVFLAAW